jgi:phospholipid N-methyltransferase
MTLQRNLTFLKKFFTQPGKNASIWPTSDNSAEMLCGSIDREKVTTVLELGPWTWPVTKYIFQSMSASATYYGIEYDAEFVELLQERFVRQQASFIQGNVKDLAALIKKHNIPFPDVIISTLPNNVFEEYPHLVNEFAWYLEKWTVFRAITYAPDLFIDVYKHIKPKVLGHTWKNIPPLYVLWVN